MNQVQLEAATQRRLLLRIELAPLAFHSSHDAADLRDFILQTVPREEQRHFQLLECLARLVESAAKGEQMKEDAEHEAKERGE